MSGVFVFLLGNLLEFDPKGELRFVFLEFPVGFERVLVNLKDRSQTFADITYCFCCSVPSLGVFQTAIPVELPLVVGHLTQYRPASIGPVGSTPVCEPHITVIQSKAMSSCFD